MKIGKKRHWFCFDGTTCGWTLFPTNSFFYASDGETVRMKTMILSDQPTFPGKPIGPRRYMDVKKAVVFMVGGCLPYDIQIHGVGLFLDRGC